MVEQTNFQKPLSTPLWWAFFALATFIMSLCFQAFKVFTVDPTWLTGLEFIGVMALLVFVTAVLIYDSYVNERQQGKVQRPVRLFERIAQWQHFSLPALEGVSHES